MKNCYILQLRVFWKQTAFPLQKPSRVVGKASGKEIKHLKSICYVTQSSYFLVSSKKHTWQFSGLPYMRCFPNAYWNWRLFGLELLKYIVKLANEVSDLYRLRNKCKILFKFKANTSSPSKSLLYQKGWGEIRMIKYWRKTQMVFRNSRFPENISYLPHLLIHCSMIRFVINAGSNYFHALCHFFARLLLL